MLHFNFYIYIYISNFSAMFILVMVRHSDQFGLIWFTLVYFSPFWSSSVQFGSIWSIRSTLVHLIHLGPIQSIGSTLVNLVHFCPFSLFRFNNAYALTMPIPILYVFGIQLRLKTWEFGDNFINFSCFSCSCYSSHCISYVTK